MLKMEKRGVNFHNNANPFHGYWTMWLRRQHFTTYGLTKWLLVSVKKIKKMYTKILLQLSKKCSNFRHHQFWRENEKFCWYLCTPFTPSIKATENLKKGFLFCKKIFTSHVCQWIFLYHLSKGEEFWFLTSALNKFYLWRSK